MSIYKYVRPERVDILEKEKIRFTQPTHFNDPFEMKPFVHSLVEDKLLNNQIESLINDSYQFKNQIESAIGSNLNEISSDELERGLTIKLTHYFSLVHPQHSDQEIQDLVDKELLKFVRNNNIDHSLAKRFYTDNFMEILDKNHQIQTDFRLSLRANIIEILNSVCPDVIRDLQQLFAKIGVLSLSRTMPVGKDSEGKNIIMWAHYTDNYKGFVIEFDDTHSFFDQRLNDHDMMRHLRQVEYTFHRPNTALFKTDNGEADNEMLTNHFMFNFFYSKSVAWKYEQESRMLLPLNVGEKLLDSKEEIYLFSLPPESFTGIYLGYKIQPDIRRRISETLRHNSRYSHVKLYQTLPDDKEFLLNAQTIQNDGE